MRAHLDYSVSETPLHYVCLQCGKGNCKLWLPLAAICGVQTTLLCVTCAGNAADVAVDDVTSDGSIPLPDEEGRTVEIGDYFPAVPTPDGTDYWDSDTVPLEAMEWWRRLPA